VDIAALDAEGALAPLVEEAEALDGEEERRAALLGQAVPKKRRRDQFGRHLDRGLPAQLHFDVVGDQRGEGAGGEGRGVPVAAAAVADSTCCKGACEDTGEVWIDVYLIAAAVGLALPPLEQRAQRGGVGVLGLEALQPGGGQHEGRRDPQPSQLLEIGMDDGGGRGTWEEQALQQGQAGGHGAGIRSHWWWWWGCEKK